MIGHLKNTLDDIDINQFVDHPFFRMAVHDTRLERLLDERLICWAQEDSMVFFTFMGITICVDLSLLLSDSIWDSGGFYFQLAICLRASCSGEVNWGQ